ncbi:F390 synthetase-related protein [Herbiconiux sp. 11R-BC]|uniref:F390 synthetase-related protein n=1 Tax=Herbiconiux sp. 11R-BC TaxID=3111637 RepID=UPI003C113A3A
MRRSMRDRALVAVLLARFVRARWGLRFRSRARFEAWQARRIRSFLRRVAGAPFYRGVGVVDRPPRARTPALAGLPVVDKSVLLEHFDALNTRGVRLADALGVALEAERTRDFRPVLGGDLTVGLSSGTSGRRGVFLVSPRERMLWAGTILGRVLDGASLRQVLMPWRPPLGIAFFLRAGGNLYESVASSRIRFAFFDLTEPLEAHLERLVAAMDAGRGPEVLVAPPSVLDALAVRALRGEPSVAPRLVISVAEVLEPATAERVRRAWGSEPRQVYQATEGLLGISCDRGALHLNEESVHVEREWLGTAPGEGRTRFTPVVTDFDRRTQIIARYRLDDVLRVDAGAPERCACGRVTAVIAAVDGRADAVLRLPSADGLRVVEVFPDAVRRVMAVESGGFADWRIRQLGLGLRVALAEPHPDAGARVTAALAALFESYGCAAPVELVPWVPPLPAEKVRRIVREDAS